MVYFASRHDIAGHPLYYVRQQVIALVVGLLAAVVVSWLDYEIYRRFQWLLYALAVLMVVLVLPLGQNVNGATRWIDLGLHALPAVGGGGAAPDAEHRRLPLGPHGDARRQAHHAHHAACSRPSRRSSSTASRTSGPRW